MLKGIGLHMKFGKMFWVEVKKNHLKGEEDASKKDIIKMCSYCQIVTAIRGYYK